MYKNAINIITNALLVSMLAVYPALALDEGIDYKTVTAPQLTETPGKIEVVELFWYGCPHCYHIEPELQKWLANKPNNVALRRMPSVLGENWIMGAKVFYAAELLGVIDKLHVPLFEAIQEEHLELNDADKVADWFATHGVPKNDFLNALNAFVVDLKVRRASQIGSELGLDGVPSFLVDGKYLTSPSMTGGTENAFKVINELIAQITASKTVTTPTAP